MKRQKRILTIQDLSCFGKCSLTVALPILSAMDIECTVIPTAVLSAHTGCFPDYRFRDLTGDISAIAHHWKQNGIALDGIYTGYLASPEQAAIVEEVIELFHPPLVFVDPAMADNGALYAGFDGRIVSAMRRLVSSADVIVPNLTEAALLLGEPCGAESEHTEAKIKKTLASLAELGAKNVILTGVCRDEMQGAVGYCAATGEMTSYFDENLPLRLPGTGDVFASVLFGALVNGRPLHDAIALAVEFTLAALHATMGDPTHWYGVRFEACLSLLTHTEGDRTNSL